ncbi:hypothetical protein [Cohnella soli]|uniref:Uncharacterized protein n=1 Tax=Cohnella soli TaxID=425005 RepID=A0ABW0I020_9BACL
MNTFTLDEIGPQLVRVIFLHTVEIAIGIKEEHEVFQVSSDLVTACLALKINWKDNEDQPLIFEGKRCLKVGRTIFVSERCLNAGIKNKSKQEVPESKEIVSC